MHFLMLMVFGAVMVISADQELLQDFAQENNQVIGNIYKELVKTNPDNFLVCPLSLQTIFALLSDGAKENTAKEIFTSLNIPENEYVRALTFYKLSIALQANKKYILNSANKIYLADSFKMNNSYRKIANAIYLSDVQNIDFGENKQAVTEINKWVENKTHDKIKDLLGEDMVSNSTAAVLVNALYFQGKWLKPFEHTIKLPFYFKNNTVLVNMMKVVDDFKYYESSELKAKFLELPYEGDEMSLTVVLPNKAEDLYILESNISAILSAPKYEIRRVNIYIPEFKIDTTIPFVPILRNLGIIDAFTSAANFSGISDEPFSISDVIQKAFIEVDETGTVAAAATAIIVNRMGEIDYDYSFVANHPFIFYLKHRENGVVFIGRYSTPGVNESEPWENSL